MVAEQPKSARNKYLLGRALAAAQRTEEAATQYRAAAEAGEIEAAYRLGLMYVDGKNGIEPSDAEAAIWLTKAAAGGYIDAAAELALLDWRRTKRDESRAAALALVNAAADHGSVAAQRFLSDQALDKSEPDLAEALYRLLVVYRLSSGADSSAEMELENKIAALTRRLSAPVAVGIAQKARAWAAR